MWINKTEKNIVKSDKTLIEMITNIVTTHATFIFLSSNNTIICLMYYDIILV